MPGQWIVPRLRPGSTCFSPALNCSLSWHCYSSAATDPRSACPRPAIEAVDAAGDGGRAVLTALRIVLFVDRNCSRSYCQKYVLSPKRSGSRCNLRLHKDFRLIRALRSASSTRALPRPSVLPGLGCFRLEWTAVAWPEKCHGEWLKCGHLRQRDLGKSTVRQLGRELNDYASVLGGHHGRGFRPGEVLKILFTPGCPPEQRGPT